MCKSTQPKNVAQNKHHAAAQKFCFRHMSSINFENVKALVWQQLESLDKNLFYHGRHHTFDDVLPTAIEIGKAENLTEEQLLIVSTAALYHDTGFLDQYEKNEPMGVERARQQLPQFGYVFKFIFIITNSYTQDQIDQIAACIMATQVPQQPASNILAQVVCDADLAHLGKDTYFLRGKKCKFFLHIFN